MSETSEEPANEPPPGAAGEPRGEDGSAETAAAALPVPVKKKIYFSIAVVFLAVLVCAWIMYWLSVVFVPLLVALALAYILNPAAHLLEKRGLSRVWAVRWLYIGLAVLTCILLAVIIPLTIYQINDWLKTLPELRERGREYLAELAEQDTFIGQRLDYFGNEEGRKKIETFVHDKAEMVVSYMVDVLTGSINTLFTLVLALVLIPIYCYYFLIGISGIYETVMSYVPQSKREKTAEILRQIHHATSAFFRGRLMVCALVAAVTAAGFWIGGVPLAIPLGVLLGIANLVPFLPFVLAVPVYITAVFSIGFWPATIWVWGPVCLGSGVLDNVLTAAIMSKQKELHLHTVTIVVSLFLFGAMFGFVGMLLSIPIAATCKILARELLLPHFQRVADN